MSPYSSTTRSQSQSPRNSPQMRYRSMSSRPVPASAARPAAGKQPHYTNFNFQGLTNRRLYNNNNAADSPGTPQRSRQTANLLARLVFLKIVCFLDITDVTYIKNISGIFMTSLNFF